MRWIICATVLVSGCIDDGPARETQQPSIPIQCLPESHAAAAIIVTEVGEHSLPSGFSSSYADFGARFPIGSSIQVQVNATWDSGLAGERTLEFRLEDQAGNLLLSKGGTSPVQFNGTVNIPASGFRVSVLPSSNSVNKQEVRSEVLLTQVKPC